MTQYNDTVEKIIRAVYLYGYDRAKKGLNRHNGYTDDETQAIMQLLQEARINERKAAEKRWKREHDYWKNTAEQFLKREALRTEPPTIVIDGNVQLKEGK